MKKEKLPPFTVISSPDDRFKIWIQRPTYVGRIVCTCGFSLKGRMPFVDSLDELDYVKVEDVNNIDQDMSHIILRTKCNDNTVRLIEDLPELIEKHLVRI